MFYIDLDNQKVEFVMKKTIVKNISISLACLLGAGSSACVSLITNLPKKAQEVKALATDALFVRGQDLSTLADNKIAGTESGYIQIDYENCTITINNYRNGHSALADAYVENDGSLNWYCGLWLNATNDYTFIIEGDSVIQYEDNDNFDGIACGAKIITNNHNITFTGDGQIDFIGTYWGNSCYGLYFDNETNTTSKLIVDGPNIQTDAYALGTANLCCGISNGSGYSDALGIVINSGYVFNNITGDEKTAIGINHVHDLTINDGWITNRATYGKNLGYGMVFDGCGNSPASININKGSITSIGKDYGIYFNRAATDNDLIVNFGAKIDECTIQGSTSAFGYKIENDEHSGITHPGEAKGWTDVSGTGEGTTLPASITPYRPDSSYKLFKVDLYKTPAVIESDPVPYTDLVYNGEEQELLEEGLSTKDGFARYSLDSTDDYSPAMPSATNAGTYTIYYYVEGDYSHTNSETKSITATIAKVSTYKVEPSAKTGLSYTGEPQELVNKGELIEGEILYKVNDGEWSTSIPKATKSGTYNVSYKVEEGANHASIAEKTIQVTIAKSDIPEEDEKVGLPPIAVIFIVLGAIILTLGIAYVLFFFVFNKWIRKEDKALRAFKLFGIKKNNKLLVMVFPFKFEYKQENEIFNTKEEALK